MRASIWISFFSFALCLLSLAHCGEDRPVIEVTLTGLTDDVKALSIDATLGGHALDGGRRNIDQAASTFNVYLQSTDTGALVLKVGGLDKNGCQIAYGRGLLTITGTGTVSLPIELSTESQYLGCKLTVTRSGTGAGAVTIKKKQMNADLGTDTDTDTDMGTDMGTDADSTDSVSCDFGTADDVPCEVIYSVGASIEVTAVAQSGSYFAGWTGDCDGVSTCSLTISPQPATVKVGLLPTKLCNGNFCWEHPLPQGNSLTALYGEATDDIWMVGEAGTILHWNGVYTEAVTSTNVATLHAVWGTVSKSTDTSDSTSMVQNIWAAGDGGTILRWDGAPSRPC